MLTRHCVCGAASPLWPLLEAEYDDVHEGAVSMNWPPSTTRHAPVTYAASSEQRALGGMLWRGPIGSKWPRRIRTRKSHPWVSRGGLKLEHSVTEWGVDFEGVTAIGLLQ